MNLEMIDVPRKQAYPARVTEFTLPFWEALGNGRFRSTTCNACGKLTFPPKPVCPHCWSGDLRWSDVTPRGVLYSWTRVHAAPTAFKEDAPYSVAIVDLEQGVRIACRLMERADIDPVPGMLMEIIVLRYQDGPMFAARPAP
jgi:uncharacterized OB-fold protein